MYLTYKCTNAQNLSNLSNSIKHMIFYCNSNQLVDNLAYGSEKLIVFDLLIKLDNLPSSLKNKNYKYYGLV